MSSGKFASVTASLLARKGEGQPWTQGGTQSAVPVPAARMPLPWRSEVRNDIRSEPRVAPAFAEASAGKPPPPPAKDKSCSVRMSAHDYERLGILAVKIGRPRQQLLKDALMQFLDSQAQYYESRCHCLGTAQCATPCQP